MERGEPRMEPRTESGSRSRPQSTSGAGAILTVDGVVDRKYISHGNIHLGPPVTPARLLYRNNLSPGRPLGAPAAIDMNTLGTSVSLCLHAAETDDDKYVVTKGLQLKPYDEENK
ncbi:hypothetical protein EVAR_53035_1 [Eumeta japonica]|uniref:Uncharacterized protein n=1 Tax=Eumeta variegata TaxID=151549 RepID=A0A4C1XKV6_EUMVA|nr:hypothetical protein EVAR_53035_1 [Eumeta japonica]